MIDLVFQLITEAVYGMVVFTFAFVTVCVIYHLIFDEDDPVKLRLESESFDREWKELCSKL